MWNFLEKSFDGTQELWPFAFVFFKARVLQTVSLIREGVAKFYYEIAAVGRVSDESRVPGGIIY